MCGVMNTKFMMEFTISAAHVGDSLHHERLRVELLPWDDLAVSGSSQFLV